MNRLLIFALTFALSFPAFSQQRPANGARPAPPQPPPNTRTHLDMAYVPQGHERQKLDLYLPEGVQNPPLVVWIHGGAWKGGNKRGCPAFFLLSEGFAVASINYRLSQHSRWPAQIDDCREAIRWLRKNAAEYGYDPDRIGVWGQSAGGHLVALLGTTSDLSDVDKGKVSSRVQAVCNWCGPSDFPRFGPFSRTEFRGTNSPIYQLFGGTVQEKPELAREASPITFVSAGDPPFLIVHGDLDNTVPLTQSEYLYDALKKAGVDADLQVLKGAGHVFNNAETYGEVKKFFTGKLKKTRAN